MSTIIELSIKNTNKVAKLLQSNQDNNYPLIAQNNLISYEIFDDYCKSDGILLTDRLDLSQYEITGWRSELIKCHESQESKKLKVCLFPSYITAKRKMNVSQEWIELYPSDIYLFAVFREINELQILGYLKYQEIAEIDKSNTAKNYSITVENLHEFTTLKDILTIKPQQLPKITISPIDNNLAKTIICEYFWANNNYFPKNKISSKQWYGIISHPEYSQKLARALKR